MKTEREHFNDYRDKNKDGKMDRVRSSKANLYFIAVTIKSLLQGVYYTVNAKCNWLKMECPSFKVLCR